MKTYERVRKKNLKRRLERFIDNIEEKEDDVAVDVARKIRCNFSSIEDVDVVMDVSKLEFSKIKKYKTRNGETMNRFTVIFDGVLVTGFRIIEGVIFGPSVSSGRGGFYRMLRMRKVDAEAFYDVVTEKYIDTGIVENLKPKAVAIGPLLMKPTELAYYMTGSDEGVEEAV